MSSKKKKCHRQYLRKYLEIGFIASPHNVQSLVCLLNIVKNSVN